MNIGVQMDEASTAYNAGVISALEKELIQPWEAERMGGLPQWARSLVNRIIKRLANSRDEVNRLRSLLTETGQKAIEAAAENERLRGTLTRIAMQQKTDELEEPENADFEGGYDAIIEDAREALGK